jgi:multidrug resistance protein MdtO
MAAQPSAVEQSSRISDWLPAFFKSELAPYPGRVGSVIRTVVSVVIALIIVSTFRIPYGAIGVFTVFIITGDTPAAAMKTAFISILATGVGVGIALLGVVLTIDNPPVRFLWIAGEFFVLFWLARVMVQPIAAILMGTSVYISSNIWELPYPAPAHVNDTLWFWLATSIGCIVPALVQAAFTRQNAVDLAIVAISRRLKLAESLFRAAITDPHGAAYRAAQEEVNSLAIVGTGRVRRLLRFPGGAPANLRQYFSELNAVNAFSGRLVDIAANLDADKREISRNDAERLSALADELASLDSDMKARRRPPMPPLSHQDQPSGIPVLPELERTVVSIARVLNSGETERPDIISVLDEEPQSRIFLSDAFTNIDYLKFALSGCLATMICYTIYNALDWQGISTSVITCLLTALSTLGASKQRQFLRITGAAAGGLIAIFALVFLFPVLQSITTVTLVFAFVTAIAAWFATSTPRLAYFGIQLGLAFYLTALQDYSTPLSLTPPRDRLVGVLLGLSAMWLVFDHLWPTYAILEIKKTFQQNLRLVASLVIVFEGYGTERVKAIPKIRALREQINNGLNAVHTYGGTILFEFGPQRRAHLLMRERILRWQTTLRTIFLVELGLVQYRLHVDLSQLSQEVIDAQEHFGRLIASELEGFACAIENMFEPQLRPAPDLEGALAQVSNAINEWSRSQPAFSVRAEAVLSFSRELVTLIEMLRRQIAHVPSAAEVEAEVQDPLLQPVA